MRTPCEKCKWAIISDKPRTIKNGNSVINMSGGSYVCSRQNIGTITFSGSMDDMRCSSFEEKDGTEPVMKEEPKEPAESLNGSKFYSNGINGIQIGCIVGDVTFHVRS